MGLEALQHHSAHSYWWFLPEQNSCLSHSCFANEMFLGMPAATATYG